jgi:hypothetical protein
MFWFLDGLALGSAFTSLVFVVIFLRPRRRAR